MNGHQWKMRYANFHLNRYAHTVQNLFEMVHFAGDVKNGSNMDIIVITVSNLVEWLFINNASQKNALSKEKFKLQNFKLTQFVLNISADLLLNREHHILQNPRIFDRDYHG